MGQACRCPSHISRSGKKKTPRRRSETFLLSELSDGSPSRRDRSRGSREDACPFSLDGGTFRRNCAQRKPKICSQYEFERAPWNKVHALLRVMLVSLLPYAW